MTHHRSGNNPHDDETNNEDRQNRGLVEPAVFHQLLRGLDQSVPESDGPQEGRHQHQRDGSTDGFTPQARNIIHDFGTHPETKEQHRDDNSDVDDDMLDLTSNETRHAHLLATLHLEATILVFKMAQPLMRDATA